MSIGERCPLLVLGIGSPFGADRLGWQVVEGLLEGAANEPALPMHERLCLDRPGLGLLAHLEGRWGVILVDAVRHQGRTGQIHVIRPCQLAFAQTRLSSHSAGVAESLQLAQILRLWPTRLRVYGIEMPAEGEDDGPQERLDAQRRLACLIRRCLRQWHGAYLRRMT